MAQLTLYIDDETRAKIEAAATAAGDSVSAWVSRQLRAVVAEEWPENYFKLLGSLSESDLERPADVPFGKDAKREDL